MMEFRQLVKSSKAGLRNLYMFQNNLYCFDLKLVVYFFVLLNIIDTFGKPI